MKLLHLPAAAARLRGTVLTRFHLYLAGIGVLALALRVAACIANDDHLIQGDALVYREVAKGLAEGEGFREAFRFDGTNVTPAGPTAGPTAEHPPLWEVVLAGAHLLRLEGTLSHRLIGAVLGTVTVVLVGLLGRRLAGNAVGLVATAAAAAYPMLWAADTTIMSESLYGALVVGALLAAAYRRPVILGLLVGLAALTRGEALALMVLLAVPLFWRRWRQLALSFAVFAVVLAPWTVRNLVTFEEPVFISSNANGIWTGANCEEAYYGDLIGSWYFSCYTERQPDEDESEYYARQRDDGLSYLAGHVERLPAVMGVRLLRLLDMWHVDQSVYLNEGEGRPEIASRLGFVAFWALLPFAVAGAVLLRRRREPSLILLAPVVLVVAVSVATYGGTRFRYAAEPSVVVLASIAVVALGTRLLPVMRRYVVRGRHAGRATGSGHTASFGDHTEEPPVLPSAAEQSR